MKSDSKRNIKKLWHFKSKPIVHQYLNGRCSICKKQVGVDEGSIHHLHYDYPKGLYTTDPIDQIREGVITWICHPCHTDEHTAESLEEREHLQNIGICAVCGKKEHGIWDRMKGENLSEPRCRSCYQIRKHGGGDQIGLF